MSRVILLTTVMLVGLGLEPAGAQWKRAADLGLTFNQSSYSDSWTGGESGALTWAFTSNLSAEKALSSQFNWANTLKLTFGQTHTQAEGATGKKEWQVPKKSADRIFLESLMRMTLGKLVDPFGSVTVESQFYDASEPRFARYGNPVLINEAAGVGRMFVKNDLTEVFSRFGFGLRQNHDRRIVSVDPDRAHMTTSREGGLDWVTDFSHTFRGGQMKYVTKLRAFKALFSSRADATKGTPVEDYWQEPDVAWENTFSASISKYIQVSLFTELLYDKEVDLRGRFREVVGLGLAYKLF